MILFILKLIDLKILSIRYGQSIHKIVNREWSGVIGSIHSRITCIGIPVTPDPDFNTPVLPKTPNFSGPDWKDYFESQYK